jgi:metal-responsive CopG/Arc/MetJ family transcriptional regulator
MKQRITISIEANLLSKIEKKMRLTMINDRSKYINYIIRQAMYDPLEQFKFMERIRNDALRRFRAANEAFLEMEQQLRVEAEQQQEKALKVVASD